MSAQRPAIGDRFNSTIADSNSLWEITGKVSGGYRAVCVDEDYVMTDGRTIPSDFAGTVKLFTTGEVKRALKWAEVINQMFVDQDDFWANASVGDTLHYCNGFGEMVRGTVVVLTAENTSDRRYGTDGLGQKGLLPTALVGTWAKRLNDRLVWRNADGSIGREHFAELIVSGRGAWQPNEQCVWESPHCSPSYKKDPDPRGQDPIDISDPPEPEGDAARRAGQERAVRDVGRFVGDLRNYSDPADALREILLIATQGLTQAAEYGKVQV